MVATLQHGPGELRELARDLLSRPPYREVADEGLLDRLLGMVRDAIAEVLVRVLGVISGSTAAAWTLVLVGTAILGVAVWRWTRGTRREAAQHDARVPAGRRSVAAWLSDADAHAADGRYADAVRCAYAALVEQLIVAGRIEDRPGRTVRELDREVAVAAPDLAAAVDTAGEVFEAAWYGRQPADRSDLEVVLAAVGSAGTARVGAL